MCNWKIAKWLEESRKDLRLQESKMQCSHQPPMYVTGEIVWWQIEFVLLNNLFHH